MLHRADCFNYYEHESAEHPQNPHDPDLIHGHSGSVRVALLFC